MASNEAALYSSLLAAYKTMKDGYNNTRPNIIIALTDGADSVPRMIRREQFKQDIQKLADPTKPIRVVIIGISVAPADAPNLAGHRGHRRRRVLPLTSPEQIQMIFLKASCESARAQHCRVHGSAPGLADVVSLARLAARAARRPRGPRAPRGVIVGWRLVCRPIYPEKRSYRAHAMDLSFPPLAVVFSLRLLREGRTAGRGIRWWWDAGISRFGRWRLAPRSVAGTTAAHADTGRSLAEPVLPGLVPSTKPSPAQDRGPRIVR